jgi:hypothetical protein
MITIIILSALVLTIGGVLISTWFQVKNRKKETSDWQVGDMIAIHRENDLYDVLGWSDEAFYVQDKNDVKKLEWDRFNFNKSAVWRRNYKNCGDYMNGVKPGFNAVIKPSSKIKIEIDGKAVELLTEIECQIYLKKALDSENYELAESIKKQMEKYR